MATNSKMNENGRANDEGCGRHPKFVSRHVVPVLRRGVQVLSIIVLVILPLLALYSHYKEARAIADLPQHQWRSRAVRAIDRVVGDNPQRAKMVAQTQGTVWSARIAGISLTDPLAGLETIATSRSFYAPLLWSLLIPVAVTLLLGRVFCGWICPMNTLLELVDKGRHLLRWLEIRERNVRFSLKNKYVVLGLAIGFAAVSGVPFLALVYPPAVLSREMHLIVFGGSVGVGVYFILAICAFELFVSKRWWCRYICPGGAVYSLLGRFRAVRIRRDENRCTQCGDCVRICQFDLRPMLVQTTGMECTNCGACVKGCEFYALSYKLVLPTSKGGGEKMTNDEIPSDEGSANDECRIEGGETSRPAKQNALTSSLAALSSSVTGHSTFLSLFVAASTFVFLAPSVATAHHILGLPHYSYKENYPQTPTLEYPATTGPYDVLMTSYPGKPVPGEAATIAFYIKNRQTNRPYDQPVTVQVLKTATFGASEVILPPATHRPFDNEHKYTITFPEDHEYVVELTLEVEGKKEVIPFLVVAGQPTATKSILLAIFAAMAIFLVVVRAVKVKRDRRRGLPARASAKLTPPNPLVE